MKSVETRPKFHPIWAAASSPIFPQVRCPSLSSKAGRASKMHGCQYISDVCLPYFSILFCVPQALRLGSTLQSPMASRTGLVCFDV